MGHPTLSRHLFFVSAVILGCLVSSPRAAADDCSASDIKAGIVGDLMALMEDWIPPANRACPNRLTDVLGMIPERGSKEGEVSRPSSNWPFTPGKVLVLDFWSSACVPCMNGLPRVEKLRQELGDKASTAFVTRIDGGQDQAKVERVVKAQRAGNNKSGQSLMASPVLVLGESSQIDRDFGIIGIPRIVVLDKKGRIAWRGSAEKRVDVVVDELNKEDLSSVPDCKMK